MRELLIGKNDGGQRLDKFLSKALPDLPKALLYKSIRTKKIKVNRKRAVESQMLKEGDCLQLFLSEEFFGGREADTVAIQRIRPRINPLYEDENILLLHKPAGVSVHEDEGNRNNNLITHVKAYLFEKGEYDPENEQSFAPALANRIDRNTSGIVIAAKNAESLRILNERIRDRELDKRYLAVLHGIPEAQEATLRAYLKKNADENIVRVRDREWDGSKEILTRYRLLSTVSSPLPLSLAEVTLLTGRTHQIRAHMAHIGHPLLGDGKYGENREDRRLGYAYQALAAYRLTFRFESDAGPLQYLNGHTFRLSRGDIPFLALFPDFNGQEVFE